MGGCQQNTTQTITTRADERVSTDLRWLGAQLIAAFSNHGTGKQLTSPHICVTANAALIVRSECVIGVIGARTVGK